MVEYHYDSNKMPRFVWDQLRTYGNQMGSVTQTQPA